MKKLFSLLLILLAAVILSLTAAAEETVIYENDFSDNSILSDFHSYKAGSWTVSGGRLKVKGSGTSTFLSYEIPAQYEGLGYQIDVDMYNITSMGGILVGATADTITGKTPSYFYGYTCTTVSGSATGTEKAYIGYFSETGGWGGNFPPSTQPIPKGTDVHLMVRVQKACCSFA